MNLRSYRRNTKIYLAKVDPCLVYNKHIPAVYNKDIHYVINKKLTLETPKKISACEQVLQISDEYTGCSATMGALYELNQRNSSKYSFYG
jgi:hypothetical protein